MKTAVFLAVASTVGLLAAMTVALPDAPSKAQPGSLLFPRPKPVASMSLAELEAFQVAALSHYRGAWRAHERVAGRRPLSRREFTHRRWYRLASAWTARELATTREVLRVRRLSSMGPREAICYVFGGYCQQALAVAYCETGGSFSVYARNANYPPGDEGDYLGLFQFGDYARSAYGFSWTALGQARAAYRYFRDAGGWGPWSCKP